MPTLPTINQQLWVHMTRGGGLAAMIRAGFSRNRNSNWTATLAAFFDTTDDYSRIVAGRTVSECLLRQRNMDYLVSLRDIVTEMELSRSTLYPKQTDHTVHTLYLFFLGIWIFDHSPYFRKCYADYYVIGDKSPRWSNDDFLLQWLFSGLMHDIGYIFENVTPETRKFRLAVDNLFQVNVPAILKLHFPYCSATIIKRTCSHISRCIRDWSLNGEFPCFANAKSPSELIMELNKAPWTKDMNLMIDGTTSSLLRLAEKDVVKRNKIIPCPSVEKLVEYGNKVASCGYFKNTTPLVDHAFAGGYLLLQLTSLRYWVVRTVGAKYQNVEEKLSGQSVAECFPGFRYDYSTLVNQVGPACHAVASHNIVPNAVVSSEILPFCLNNSPLVFFAVLCDELQQWHRAPVGEKLTKAPFSVYLPKEDQIYLEAGSVWSEERPGFGCSDKTIAAKVVDSVQAKLTETSISKMFSFFGEARRHEHDKELQRLLDNTP